MSGDVEQHLLALADAARFHDPVTVLAFVDASTVTDLDGAAQAVRAVIAAHPALVQPLPRHSADAGEGLRDDGPLCGPQGGVNGLVTAAAWAQRSGA